ncbi:MAG: hypothetical protein M3083_08720 [Actinomycetota bacterium]|nr:hypothetical protein [Actinomycetota bacterium]
MPPCKLELAADATTCTTCGQVVVARSLNQHRGASSLCRWLRAVAEVRRRWEDGWRDPWSVPDAPLRWTDLTAKKAWRDRLAPVSFPLWTAVLLSPAPTPRGRSVEAPGASRPR